MNNIFHLALYSLLTALLISYFATPLVIRLVKKLRMVDDPKKHRHPKVIHTYPVPRGGGLAIYLGVLISSLIFLPIDKHLLAILFGATVIVFLGLLDDRYDLNPYARLVIQVLAATMPIVGGIGVAFITNPFNGVVDLSQFQIHFSLLGQPRSIWILSDLFALFWIVFMMNMLNMGAKGIDGQLPGVALIAGLIIAALSLQYSADITQWPVIVLAFITAGAFWGFLPWNHYPQKIMPSFGGSSLAGYLLAVLAILSTAKIGTLLVVLGVPIIDTGYTIIRRMLAGKSPVWGDRGHLHHKLLDSGLSKRQVVWFYWGVTALLGIIALQLKATYKLYTIVGVAVGVGGLLLWLTYRSKS